MTSPVLGTVVSGNIAACTGFPGASSAEEFNSSDILIANSASWTTIKSVNLTTAGTYLITGITQLNYVRSTGTQTQEYVDIALSTTGSSDNRGSLNVTVVDAFNVIGTVTTILTIAGATTVYFLAKYVDSGGGSSGGGAPYGTKITYARLN